MTKNPPNPSAICVGEIKGAHGVRGVCLVRAFTQSPADLAAYGALQDASGGVYEINTLSSHKNNGELLRVQFAHITNREAAQALAGVQLYIDRAALPALRGDKQFYHADLIGLAVRNAAGVRLGEVAAVHNFGAGDILDVFVKENQKNDFMVALSDEFVSAINIKENFLIVSDAALAINNDKDNDR